MKVTVWMAVLIYVVAFVVLIVTLQLLFTILGSGALDGRMIAVVT